MERQEYLIDTNAIIDFLAGKLPANGREFLVELVDDIPKISVISKIELLGFQTTYDQYEILSGFVHDAKVLGLSETIVDKCIDLRRNHKIKLPDGIVAATALAFNLSLVTRNVSDFINIPNLIVINPHNL